MTIRTTPAPTRVAVVDTWLAVDFPDLIEAARRDLPEWDLRVPVGIDSPTGPPAMPEADARADPLPAPEVYIGARPPDVTLAAGTPLRLHIVPYAGVNRLPIAAYREAGVLLASSHGNALAVAERAVALAYAAAGRVVSFDRGLREGRWHRRADERDPFVLWRSLAGARVAILGGGAIGERVAELLRPLVGTVTALVRTPRASAAPFDDLSTRPEHVLDGADLVIAAMPLTDETRGLLTPTALRLTRQAIFVNVGRAEVIAEEDLWTVLHDGTIEAAGLDVWYRSPEPFWADAAPGHRPFGELDNVVLSPHAASHAREGKRGQLAGALAVLREYAATGTVARAVTESHPY